MRKTFGNSASAEAQLIEQIQSVDERVVDIGSLPPKHSHGNAEWTPLLLTTTALIWAWQSLGTLTSRFDEARTVPATYQSFVKALAVDSSALP